MEALIREAARDRAQVPALAQQLVLQHVYIVASWDSPQSTSIKIQDFVRNGESFLPVFSDEAHFKQETKGSGFEGSGVSIDGTLLASMLAGHELLVLNPGSRTPVDLRAEDLKAFARPERLRSGAK